MPIGDATEEKFLSSLGSHVLRFWFHSTLKIEANDFVKMPYQSTPLMVFSQKHFRHSLTPGSLLGKRTLRESGPSHLI
jgi:hypothetical protein